jgi:hypothetical protein
VAKETVEVPARDVKASALQRNQSGGDILVAKKSWSTSVVRSG